MSRSMASRASAMPYVSPQLPSTIFRQKNHCLAPGRPCVRIARTGSISFRMRFASHGSEMFASIFAVPPFCAQSGKKGVDRQQHRIEWIDIKMKILARRQRLDALKRRYDIPSRNAQAERNGSLMFLRRSLSARAIVSSIDAA